MTPVDGCVGVSSGAQRLLQAGKALSVATVFEIEDVIDPAETRSLLNRALAHRGP